MFEGYGHGPPHPHTYYIYVALHRSGFSDWRVGKIDKLFFNRTLMINVQHKCKE